MTQAPEAVAPSSAPLSPVATGAAASLAAGVVVSPCDPASVGAVLSASVLTPGESPSPVPALEASASEALLPLDELHPTSTAARTRALVAAAILHHDTAARFVATI